MNRIIKLASLLVAAVMLASCGGEDGSSVTKKALILTSDKNLIMTDGEDHVTFTLTLDGVPVTENVTFYDKKNNILEVEDFEFYADEPGEYVIWANYGTYNSNQVTIKATDLELPDVVEDPNPESTSFKVRSLLVEFTTVGCAACPSMKTILHEALEDEATADKLVVTSCHAGLVNAVADPCYVHTGFDDFIRITGYPTVSMDMYGLWDNSSIGGSSTFKQTVSNFVAAKTTAPGISVNSVCDKGELVARVTVKSAETAQYRIGAFLVEDGIVATQTNTSVDWMHTHNGVIRYIDSRYYTASGEQFYGHLLGEVEEGKTADYLFAWSLDDIWTEGNDKGEIYGGIKWDPFKMDDLHLVVFVTTIARTEKNEFYYVANVIDCPLNGETPFEYAE